MLINRGPSGGSRLVLPRRADERTLETKPVSNLGLVWYPFFQSIFNFSRKIILFSLEKIEISLENELSKLALT